MVAAPAAGNVNVPSFCQYVTKLAYQPLFLPTCVDDHHPLLIYLLESIMCILPLLNVAQLPRYLSYRMNNWCASKVKNLKHVVVASRVRMGVPISHSTMCSPSSMSDTYVTRHLAHFQIVFNFKNLASALPKQ